MEHISALLLLIGCSGDFKQCNELPSPVTVFESYEECAATMSPALSELRGQRAKILAKCIYVDPAMEEEDAQLFWDVDHNGKLTASIEATGGLVAMEAHQPVPKAH